MALRLGYMSLGVNELLLIYIEEDTHVDTSLYAVSMETNK